MQYPATVADTRPLDSTTSAGILLSDNFLSPLSCSYEIPVFSRYAVQARSTTERVV